MEKQKIDCDKMSLINGELKESKNDLDNLKDFIKRWQEKIKNIKDMKLDNKQAYNIAKGFVDEAYIKFLYQDTLKDKFTILDQINNDLMFSLFKANNSYKKEFPSFWDRFHQLKLPDLNLIKKG
jgi:hypothetical protein